MKKITYWSPVLTEIATYKAVINSAHSLIKYSNKYDVTLINSIGEFDKLKEKNTGFKIFDLNKKKNKFKGTGYISTRISLIRIFLKCFFPLKNYLINKAPDYFVIHLLTSLPLIIILLFNIKTKCILRVSGLPKMNFFRLLLWKICLKKIYLVTCPTELTRNYLINLNLIKKEKIITLYDPIIEVKKYNALKKIKTDRKDFYLAAGRLTKQKNFIFLIKTFEKLYKEKIINEKLLIAGAGELKKNLQDYINKNKIKKIELIGYQTNILNLMKNCKAYILSSLWEDPGFVLIEAAFCGSVIISSNCKNGPLEFIKNNNCGYIFESNNQEDFQTQFKKFLEDKSQNISRKKIDALKAAKKFTLFNHFKNFNSILE